MHQQYGASHDGVEMPQFGVDFDVDGDQRRFQWANVPVGALLTPADVERIQAVSRARAAAQDPAPDHDAVDTAALPVERALIELGPYTAIVCAMGIIVLLVLVESLLR